MPRTPEQYEEIRNAKKKIILDAALKLFAEKGFASSSISCIAEEANISKGLMYNYFKCKNELLKTIVLSFMNEIGEMLDPNRDDILNEQEANQFFDKYFEMLMTRTEETKLFTQLTVQPEVIQVISDSELMPDISKQGKMMISFFAGIHKENTQMVLMNYAAIIKGITVLYVFAPKKYPDEVMLQYRDYLKNMFINKI
ncbi:MAG: TetR/AcrR family transcriptional regulator [Bacteroidales bacterium]|nr:TetR/AcrR family transcriptional regulator [Bacteroidales bacterium]